MIRLNQNARFQNGYKWLTYGDKHRSTFGEFAVFNVQFNHLCLTHSIKYQTIHITEKSHLQNMTWRTACNPNWIIEFQITISSLLVKDYYNSIFYSCSS